MFSVMKMGAVGISKEKLEYCCP